MTHVLLIRHGQSEWNVERRIQGQGGTGLTDVGRRQAEGTAAMVAESWPDAVVWSSDLQRCQETAAPLVAALGIDPVHDARLRERHFGAWAGQLVADLSEIDPARSARWRRGEDVIGEVGGESSAVLAARVIAAIRDGVQHVGPDGVLICVTHGGPVWNGTHELLGLVPGTLGGVANAGVTEISMAGPAPVLSAWNQTAHLAPGLRTSQRQVTAFDVRRDAPAVGT